jgi:signal transduction histidine kinase
MVVKYNIRVQYGAWVAVVTAGAVLVLTGVRVSRTIDDQENTVRWIAEQEAKLLARMVVQPVSQGDANALLRIASQTIHDEDVLFLRVLNAKGEVLFRPPRNQDPAGLVVVTEPVISRGVRVGTVELGMERGRIGRRLWSALLWDLGLGLMLVVIFVGGSVLIVKPVQNSLSSLLNYIHAIAKGEQYDQVIDTDLAEVDTVARELKMLMSHVEDARRRLERAQKELKATQKEMDEYTYVISHDLKEPLRGMEAFSKFLSDGYRHKLDEEGQRHIDIIRKSVLRMQRLINDLLHFSRLSQQRQPMQPTGMNTLIMHVRVRLQHTLDAKRVDLRVDKLPIVVCDETAMAEVFHNLITNAVKYNDKSLPVIEIGCTERLNPDTQQPEHEFFVRDNGMGIKKEYFDKIFQVFQRLQRDEEGTGIGLTIVRRVIEWHGGRIWLESEEGKGTTFYFTIPKREFTKTGTVLDSTVTIPKGTPNLATPV